MENINIYEQILNKFVLQEEQNGIQAFYKPFRRNGKSYATNKYIMAWIEESLWQAAETENVPNVDGVIPPIEKSAVFSVEKYEKLKEDMPKYTSESIIKIDCEECEGEDEVEWMYSGKSRKYFKEFTCPVCNGNGDFKRKANEDEIGQPIKQGCVQINDFQYEFWRFDEIMECAKLLGENEVIFYQISNLMYLRIGEVQFLLSRARLEQQTILMQFEIEI